MTKSSRKPNLTTLPSRFFRRSLDLIGSLVGLILLAPLFAFIALLIKRDSPGPVLYRGPRVGKGGREFHILKFRTMHETKKSYNSHKVTAHDDPRITPFGRWLRNTKLNELPQLWNVLKGEMSLVGPRPEDPEIVKEWPEDARREILSVRPGVTSPASVIYKDEENLLNSSQVMEDYLLSILPSKLRLDLLYVRNRTLLSDLDTIFMTLVALVPRIKTQDIPEHLLFWGPLSRFFSRHLNWFLIDTLIAFLSMGITGVIWRSAGPLDLGLGQAVLIAIGTAFLFSLINILTGMNRVSWSRARPSEALGLALSSSIVTVLLQIINWLLGLPLPWGMLLVAGLLAFLGFLAARYRTRLLTGIATRWLKARKQAAHVGERVLIIGAGELGQFAAWLLTTSQHSGMFSIVGMVDDDPRKQGLRINGCDVIGNTEDIPRLVEDRDVGVILYSINNITPAQRQRILELCRATAARLIPIPDILALLWSYFPTPGAAPGSNAAQQPLNQLPAHLVADWVDELQALTQLGDLEMIASRLKSIQTTLQPLKRNSE